ncbi:MAG: hypothetical protein M1820_010791 [Bogoriella megaspora]|nr:MAG: hypothetical protein M1820_010791 [Bogoriella megaspora]
MKWAIVDRDKAKLLVDHISELNDRLMVLLDSAERTAAESTFSKLISDYISQASSVDEVTEAQQLLVSGPFKRRNVLAEVARLKSIRLSIGTDQRVDEQQPPQPQGSFPPWMPSLKRLNRKKFVSQSIDATSHCSRLDFARYDGRQVVVEWKDAQGPMWKMVQDQIKRLSLLLTSLRDNMSKENSFHCLACIGYLPLEEQGRYGLVYELPPNVTRDEKSQWRYLCLRCLISKLNSASLNIRYRIGLSLAQTLLQLHTAGWLHKGIRSENVFFFVYSEKGPSFKFIESPMYLLGYEYARTDDKEGAALTQHINTPARLEIYKHPEHRGRKRQPFRKQFDMYGLGCILLELAHWRPLIEIYANLFGNQIQAQIQDADQNNKEIELPSLSDLASKHPATLRFTKHQVGSAFAKAITKCLYMPAQNKDGADTSLETQKAVVDLLEQCHC